MILDSVLRLPFARIERPPLLWAVAGDESVVRGLVQQMVLATGKAVDGLTLNLSNVVVDASAADERLATGEYVAITIVGAGEWATDARWTPGAPPPAGALHGIVSGFEAAGAPVAAYSRALGDRSSVTVFLRAQTAPTT